MLWRDIFVSENRSETYYQLSIFCLIKESVVCSEYWSLGRHLNLQLGVTVVCSEYQQSSAREYQSSARLNSRLFDVTVVCSEYQSSVRRISRLLDLTAVYSEYQSSARCYRVICSQYQSSGRRESRRFGVSVACSDNISLVVGISKAEFQSYGRNVSHKVVFTIIITFVRVR